MDDRIAVAVGEKMLVAFEGYIPSKAILQTLRERRAAGVTLFRALNIEEPAQVRELTAALQREVVSLGEDPLLIAVDQEGGQLQAIGGATAFPGNMALGATRSAELSYRVGLALGRELRAMGVNVDYAPVCDVNNNPANPVIGVRSFGEDPALVAELTAAMVRGIQDAGVAATAKHFPGHGDAAGDSHHELPVVSYDLERLLSVELPPFDAAVRAGVRMVMTAHVGFPAFHEGLPVPATLSAPLLRGVLRERLGFEGVIVSDALDMAAIAQGDGQLIDAVAAVAAGVDLLLMTTDVVAQRRVYDAIALAARRTLIAPEDLFASAQRVRALRRWVASQGEDLPSLDVVRCAEHLALAREVAARSLTWVRDDQTILPLRLGMEDRIAVVVPKPIDLTPADTSSYERCELADVLRGYHAYVDEFVVSYAPTDGEIAALRARAADYRAVIMGTINAYSCPEQAELVKALVRTGVPVVAVALRLPYDLVAYPEVKTYLCTYSLLRPSMEALGAALWGEGAFPGSLPVSIPGLYAVGHGKGG